MYILFYDKIMYMYKYKIIWYFIFSKCLLLKYAHLFLQIIYKVHTKGPYLTVQSAMCFKKCKM